jgi:leucyl-tRNA synthetase
MQRYNPKDIEPRWQAKWEADKIYEVSEDVSALQAKPKKYILEYFPYPSGAAMHVGHVRNYTIGDVMARHARMAGYNVLHPMGWDGFGLPAENYAIKTGISPRQAIDQNTAKFKQQLMQMGFSYDWSREIDSTDPKYYRWTQWFFLLLLRKGLAYQQESLQWWCPHDKTVLANEQVEAGKCWRCGHDVEKKLLKQWFFKITDYADRLAKDLDDVDWSDSIKSMQRNWIGRSQGAQVDFKIDGREDAITVFTTRPDTLFGATFMVLSPEHQLVRSITSDQQKQPVTDYIKAAQAKSDIERQETNREKTGVFTGAYAINPVNDAKIPIWIADYVLVGYGTGAIMAVPAHDERDYEFAQKFELPVIPVVTQSFIIRGASAADVTDRNAAVSVAHDAVSDTYCLIEWPKGHIRAGLEWPGGGIDAGETISEGALREFIEETGYTDISLKRIVPAAVSFYYSSNGMNMRGIRNITELDVLSTTHNGVVGTDEYEKEAYKIIWLTRQQISDRRAEMDDSMKAITDIVFDGGIYSGEGVMINSGPYNNMTTDQVREKIVADLEKQGVGREVTNYKMRDWLISRQRYWGAPIPIIHCPTDGAVAVPDDQLPVLLPELTNIEPSGDGRSPLANVPEFVHTTCPTCGGPAERETDTMDGFACSSWYFLRFADPHNDHKPFDADKVKFWLPVDDYIGGAEHAVMHLLYARMWTKVMHDEGMIAFDEPFTTLRNQGMILAPDGAKMSKSKGNTIEPGVLIDEGYGADAVRIMELFIGPWNQSAAWSVEGMGGAHRFLQRVWTLVQEYSSVEKPAGAESPELQRALHKSIKKVSEDIETLSFNTAIASLMELVNELFRIKAADKYGATNWQATLQTLVQLVAPFAPHIAEELWQQLGQTSSVHISNWPIYDDKYLATDTIAVVVQINGKLRGQLTLPTDVDETEVVAAAHADEKIAAHLDGKEIRKTIYIPGKLLNFVV